MLISNSERTWNHVRLGRVNYSWLCFLLSPSNGVSIWVGGWGGGELSHERVKNGPLVSFPQYKPIDYSGWTMLWQGSKIMIMIITVIIIANGAWLCFVSVRRKENKVQNPFIWIPPFQGPQPSWVGSCSWYLSHSLVISPVPPPQHPEPPHGQDTISSILLSLRAHKGLKTR